MDKVLLALMMVVTLSVAVTADHCPAGWTFWEGSCYSFQGQWRVSWSDAEAKCQEADSNGHLVSIGSAEENQWVYDWWVSMLAPLSGIGFKYTWIGYTDEAEEGTWAWSDGTSTTFTNWGGRQPNNANGGSNCANMVTKGRRDPGKWDDGMCVMNRAYVCEYRASGNQGRGQGGGQRGPGRG